MYLFGRVGYLQAIQKDVIRQVLREARAEAEKHGKKWAFTDFGVEIWGKTQEDEDENSPR